MKRMLTLVLSVLLMLSMFTACGGNTATTPETTTAPTTEPTIPTQSPEEEEVFKILMIGQSHAQDASWLVCDVLSAEMPDKKFLVADIYQPLHLDQHIKNIKENNAVYDYAEITNGSNLVKTSNFSINVAVKKHQWDLIVFNEATWPQTEEASYTDGDFQWLTDWLRENAAWPYFKFAYNATWAQPVSAENYAPGRQVAPDSFRATYNDKFGGDRTKHFARICELMEKYVETDPDYDYVFHSGTAIQYASETFGVPEGDPNRRYELYRDYTHMSDFGRLIVAYQWYCQIFGIEELKEVNVNVIPSHMRTKCAIIYGDLAIDETMKQAIIESVNYALKNPNIAPPQTARETPVLEPLN